MPQAMIKKFNDGTLSMLCVKYKPEYMEKPANEKIIPPSKWFSLGVYTSQFVVFIWFFCHTYLKQQVTQERDQNITQLEKVIRAYWEKLYQSLCVLAIITSHGTIFIPSWCICECFPFQFFWQNHQAVESSKSWRILVCLIFFSCQKYLDAPMFLKNSQNFGSLVIN